MLEAQSAGGPVGQLVASLLMPAVSASAILCFVLSLADFGTPSIIGRDIRTLSTLAYNQYGSEMGGPPTLAVSISMLMIVISMLAVLLQRWFPLPVYPMKGYSLTVPITNDIDVVVAARLAGISLDEFQQLNPQLNKPVILAAGTPQVLLPYDHANRFLRELDHHSGPLASWTAWVAPRTLKPADAARLIGMSEARLRGVLNSISKVSGSDCNFSQYPEAIVYNRMVGCS